MSFLIGHVIVGVLLVAMIGFTFILDSKPRNHVADRLRVKSKSTPVARTSQSRM